LISEEWAASRPYCFNPRETASGTHYIGVWEGPRSGLDIKERIKMYYLYRESNPESSIVEHIA
jgi:hypothetical protein